MLSPRLKPRGNGDVTRVLAASTSRTPIFQSSPTCSAGRSTGSSLICRDGTRRGGDPIPRSTTLSRKPRRRVIEKSRRYQTSATESERYFRLIISPSLPTLSGAPLISLRRRASCVQLQLIASFLKIGRGRRSRFGASFSSDGDFLWETSVYRRTPLRESREFHESNVGLRVL